MRINAVNMIRQAAKCIDPKRDHAAYAFMLEEFSENLAKLRDGECTWEEFAEAYCLTFIHAKDKPATYLARVQSAGDEAGKGDDGWCARYLAALDRRGLKLAVMAPPKAHYVQAPYPFPQGPISWVNSWIVEKDDGQ